MTNEQLAQCVLFGVFKNDLPQEKENEVKDENNNSKKSL